MKTSIRFVAAALLVLPVLLLAGQSADIVQVVQQGNLEAVKSLIAKDPALLKFKNEGGDSLLFFAAGAGRLPVVEYLLSQGLDINAKNSNGQNALLYAAYQGNTDVVSLLIAKGADFKYQDGRGMTPLHFAARQGRREVVALLLDKGASPTLKNPDGQTPVESAVLAGQGEVILLFRERGLLDPKSEMGAMALHAIAAAGQRDIVEEFVKAGADLKALAPDGKTMIHSAAQGGLFQLVEHALRSGLDVRAKDKAGRTALYYAVLGGRTAIAGLLLKSGADPNADEAEGRTVLHVAEDLGEADLINALKAAGAKAKPRPEIVLEKHPVEGRPATFQIGYIANEGFRIASGKKTVLVDALVQNPWNYDNTPPSVLDRMARKEAPYERIDLLLFSHEHADHFNAAMAVRVLEAHPETVLVGNEGVKTALEREAKEKYAGLAPRIRIFNPAWGNVAETTIAGIPLKIYPVNHADFPQEYQTLGYLMNLEGLVLFHLGDSVPQANKKFLESFGLEKAGIDIAFLDSFFLRDPVGLEILPKYIQPEKIIPMHLTRQEIGTLGPELAKAHPSLLLFRDPLEVKVFRKK